MSELFVRRHPMVRVVSVPGLPAHCIRSRWSMLFARRQGYVMSKDLDKLGRGSKFVGEIGWTLVFGLLLVAGSVVLAYCF
jgi:hypothetical protein